MIPIDMSKNLLAFTNSQHFPVTFINGIYDTKVFFRHELDPIKHQVVSSLAKLLIHLFLCFLYYRFMHFCQALTRTYSLSMLVNASFFHLWAMNGFNEHGTYFSKIKNYVNSHLDQTTKGKHSQKNVLCGRICYDGV